MQKSYSGQLQQWMHNGSACVSSEYYCETKNHWKSAVTRLTTSCVVCFANESIVPRSRTLTTETTHQQQMGRYASRGHWTCCQRLASVSTCLRSCWRRTFLAYAVIYCRWCDVTRVTFSETVTASRVRRYSVNYCVDGSIRHFEFPRVVQAHTSDELGTLCSCMLRVYSWFIHTNIHWNQFMLDRPRAKNKLAPFLRQGVYMPSPSIDQNIQVKWHGIAVPGLPQIDCKHFWATLSRNCRRNTGKSSFRRTVVTAVII